MVSPEKPIDESTPEASVAPPQEDTSTFMGRSITLGSVDDSALSSGSVSDRELINFLKDEITQKPKTSELYRKAINVLGNKLITLEKSMLPKIKSIFGEKFFEEILKSSYMDIPFSAHLRSFNKLEDKIEFLRKWDRPHLRQEFIKNIKKEDLSRIAEILDQTNDLPFVLPLIFQISKTYPSILNKIPSNSDFGKLLKNHLFEVIWKIPDPDSTANRPSLEDYRSQGHNWRKRAIESIFLLSTAQQSFDFAASWLWFDESILTEFTGTFKEEQMGELSRMILKYAEKNKENYLPVVKTLFKNCPFAASLRQRLMKDPMWTSHLRINLILQSFFELNLEDTQELYYYFPNIVSPIEMVSRRFEDRSAAPAIGGLHQNLGPEAESFALSAAASTPNISSSEKHLMDLLSKKFLDAGNIYNLSVSAKKNDQQEKVALLIQNRIRSLGEIPDDLLILSSGTKEHAIVIALFKTPGSKDLKMLVTNTGLGLESHSKDTSTNMYTVTEEASVVPDIFSGEEGKEKILELLLQPFSDNSLEDLYAWIEKTTGKKFTEKSGSIDFNTWYPKRHSQHGASCATQSVRQADKYLITRILWEIGKSKTGSDPVSLEKEFWKSYTRAQELLTHVDQTFLSSFPQDDAAVLNARQKIDKKGIESFKEIAKDETRFKKAIQALDEAARRTVGRLSLPNTMDRKPEAYQLKEKVKILTKSWQSLGYTYAEIETKLKDMKDEVIKVALARYKYMQATLDRVKDIFITALTTRRLLPIQFTPREMNFICNTLNQWPEKTLEEQIGKEIILKLIHNETGEYMGSGIEDFASKLKGNRFYHLFKPLVKEVFEGITPFVAKHEYIDHFLKSITTQQKEEIRTFIPYTNLFKSKMNSFLRDMAKQNPVQYPFARERFLLYLSLILTESKPPFESFVKDAISKLSPTLTPYEEESIIELFADLARNEGKPWSRMTPEEKREYIAAQYKKAA